MRQRHYNRQITNHTERLVPTLRAGTRTRVTVLRPHTCGELRIDHVGKSATLCGWVDSYRDHGGGLFVDLRDRYGITQVVFNPPDTPAALIDESKSLRAEFVIRVTGKVAKRPAGMANPRHATGEIELRVTGFQLLNESAAPPVSPSRPGSRQDRVPGARERKSG